VRLTSLPPEAEVEGVAVAVAEVEGAAVAVAEAREAAVAEVRVGADEKAVAAVAVSAVRELPVEGASRLGAPAAKGHRDHARREVGKRVSAQRLNRGAPRSAQRLNRGARRKELAPRTRLSARKARAATSKRARIPPRLPKRVGRILRRTRKRVDRILRRTRKRIDKITTTKSGTTTTMAGAGPWPRVRSARLPVMLLGRPRVPQRVHPPHPSPIRPFPALRRSSQSEGSSTTNAVRVGTTRLTRDRALPMSVLNHRLAIKGARWLDDPPRRQPKVGTHPPRSLGRRPAVGSGELRMASTFPTYV
jgi:hypothetical protein